MSPLTEQVIAAPAATVAGGVGTQPVTVTPAGRPVTPHDAAVALAVAVALFVHVKVPVYGWFRFAVVGRPLRSIDMSEPDVVTAFVAWLLPPDVVPPLVSFEAPVVTVTVAAVVDVGVPETVQLIELPLATVAGGVGVQVPTVTPAGRPVMAHVAATADCGPALVHRMVPL